MVDLEHSRERLGPIRVGLRKDLVITRQLLRDEVAYVVHDPVTFRNHSFSVLEYRILCHIRPERSLADTFVALCEEALLCEAEEQEFYGFILGLHGTSLLQLPITNPHMLFERHERRAKASRKNPLLMLMYYRRALLNPDRFLDRTVGIFGQLFTRWGLAVFAMLMLAVLWKCWGRFGEMLDESASLITAGNIPLLYVSLVLLKVIHEFGHAYACKRFGGEVPEMGVVLILGAPCAFVDASASWKFNSVGQRVWVGLGGMYVESMVAAVFALIWVSTAPGLLHDLSLNVLVLASVVTVLFNINPLIRFDGYYVATDLLGTPNLWERSQRLIRGGLRRYLLGLEVPEEGWTRHERHIYLGYGLAAMVYKLVLALSIISMVLFHWPMAGAILGVCFAWLMLVLPTMRMLRFLCLDPETAAVRMRALGVAAFVALVLPATLLSLPVSRAVVAPAVLESTERQLLRAPNDGFVAARPLGEGRSIVPGEALLRLHDPRLELDALMAEQAVVAGRLRLQMAEVRNPAEARTARTELALLRQRSERLQAQLQTMDLRAPGAGVLHKLHVLPGSFVKRGDELAEVHGGATRLRLVLDQDQVLRCGLRVGLYVLLRWRAQPGVDVAAQVLEIHPVAGREDLPAELTVAGGGDIYGAPVPETGQMVADRAYLQVVLKPESVPLDARAGLTARVRLDAEVLTLGGWIYRELADLWQAWWTS